jgi:hypothetical protein
MHGIIAFQMLGVMKKQNVKALNSHKPIIRTQKCNDIFKCGSSFKLKLINHLSFFFDEKSQNISSNCLCVIAISVIAFLFNEDSPYCLGVLKKVLLILNSFTL